MNQLKGKKQLVLLVAILIIVVFAAVIFFGYWYLRDKKETKTAKSNQSCGELVTEDGKKEGLAPYSPVVKAKISGNFDPSKEICQWSVNGKDYGKSKPYGDYCIRYGLTFYNIGDYKITNKIEGQENCPTETTLKVTGLTDAEKARQLTIKKSGMTAEDIKLMDEYEKTKN
ncbi:MAG: hypothetical protein WC437_02935 [Patescibacteria group bacterium]|nr:hypothetical protein [Patescibacteria group bacterium]